MGFIIAILLIIVFCQLLGDFFEYLGDTFGPGFTAFFSFIGDNFYLILAFFSLTGAAYTYLIFRPHPAEKHLLAYKKGEITRQQAKDSIVATIYDPRRDPIPSAAQSYFMTKRIKALNKRVHAENEFIEELIRYIKNRAYLE